MTRIPLMDVIAPVGTSVEKRAFMFLISEKQIKKLVNAFPENINIGKVKKYIIYDSHHPNF